MKVTSPRIEDYERHENPISIGSGEETAGHE